MEFPQTIKFESRFHSARSLCMIAFKTWRGTRYKTLKFNHQPVGANLQVARRPSKISHGFMFLEENGKKSLGVALLFYKVQGL